MSVVLKRRCLDFDERDRERLELLRPHLAFLHQQACKIAAVPKDDTLLPCRPMPSVIGPPGLMQREAEVMRVFAICDCESLMTSVDILVKSASGALSTGITSY